MVLTSKTRLGKRKLEINEVRKEKQTTTSKKHDKKCFAAVENPAKNKISAPKPQTKSDMLAKMETMQELNDALLEEVKNNEEAIAILEGKEKKYQEAIKSLRKGLKTLNRRHPSNHKLILKPKPLQILEIPNHRFPVDFASTLLHVRSNLIGTWMMNMILILICISRQIFPARFVVNGVEQGQT